MIGRKSAVLPILGAGFNRPMERRHFRKFDRFARMTDRREPEPAHAGPEKSGSMDPLGLGQEHGQPALPAPDEPVNSIWAPSIVGIALLAAIGTFLFLMGSFGVEPNATAVLVLLGIDVLLILVLLGIVVRQLVRLRRANQQELPARVCIDGLSGYSALLQQCRPRSLPARACSRSSAG